MATIADKLQGDGGSTWALSSVERYGSRRASCDGDHVLIAQAKMVAGMKESGKPNGADLDEVRVDEWVNVGGVWKQASGLQPRAQPSRRGVMPSSYPVTPPTP